MKSILVDTSVIIDYLRRTDKKNSLFYNTFAKTKHKAYISLTTITDLWAGISMKNKNPLKR